SILNNRGICDESLFNKNVSFLEVDMNNIPPYLIDYDFTWSSCCFEHLGDIRKGLDFVKNSINCLKSGGIAVHTTEYNVSSNDTTITEGSTVLFRKRDIEQLVKELTEEGHYVYTVNYNIGNSKL